MNRYGGTNRLLTYLQSHNNITVHHVDTCLVEAVLSKVTHGTALILLETPTNPLMNIADIKSIADAAKKINKNVLVCVDNTMMSPYLQKPLLFGADIVYHSGTKYLCGHHDLMAGVIGVNSASLADLLFFSINSIGAGLSPFDCFLLTRGIKTLSIRMEKQQSNAMVIATWLEAKGFKVNYPGLKSHPQYTLHHRYLI